jgi:UDP-N-acetylmuramyl pentapeptide synthase
MAARAFDRCVDWLTTDGKEAAKALYGRPVIGAAQLWRRTLRDTRFIGVTGSAAKTTTKELLHAILAGEAPSAKSSDSNNQFYSVARTLIGTRPGHRYCVQELGASEPGGFGPMLALLQPQVGVITTIGTDHYTAFRTREAVAQEKARLLEALPADGLAVLNADDALVAGMGRSSRARVVTFGLQGPADFKGEILRSGWPDRLTLQVSCANAAAEIPTRLCGAHQSVAVLAAIATACSLGVTMHDAADRVAAFEPPLGRMSLHRTPQGVTFLRDDWKAPLWSVAVAFECIAQARADRRIIVLGSLSDINGNNGRRYRQTVAAALAAADHVVAVGDWASSVAYHLKLEAAGRLSAFDTVEDATAWSRHFLRPGDLVLLKGSNTADHLGRIALAAERTVNCWRRDCGRQIFCDHCRLVDSSVQVGEDRRGAR